MNKMLALVAQVCIAANNTKILCEYIVFVDLNECDANPCHVNADCTNTLGTFLCTCNVGFTGNGFECQGMLYL